MRGFVLSLGLIVCSLAVAVGTSETVAAQPTGGRTVVQSKNRWPCGSEATAVKCFGCCFSQGQQVRKLCVDAGFGEDYCERQAETVSENCSEQSCG